MKSAWEVERSAQCGNHEASIDTRDQDHRKQQLKTKNGRVIISIPLMLVNAGCRKIQVQNYAAYYASTYYGL